MEEYVNGCEFSASYFGCSRCSVQANRNITNTTSHYNVESGVQRSILTHIEDVLHKQTGAKYIPIDVLLYPVFDGIKGTAQDILHPYLVVFGSLLPYFNYVSH